MYALMENQPHVGISLSVRSIHCIMNIVYIYLSVVLSYLLH